MFFSGENTLKYHRLPQPRRLIKRRFTVSNVSSHSNIKYLSRSPSEIIYLHGRLGNIISCANEHRILNYNINTEVIND